MTYDTMIIISESKAVHIDEIKDGKIYFSCYKQKASMQLDTYR